ncbi:hypothetical protein POM88_037683 [Heracleum sosnowskyi]|uniref:Prolamin-like domain-containing protein n=1 Tax=Heracleum sosnowskyi TaxID=360622 RepID=A0AAD8HRL2_9APIA|nr:hypothetical protein POM88_037683 [Heracleum sosnowskyi]
MALKYVLLFLTFTCFMAHTSTSHKHPQSAVEVNRTSSASAAKIFNCLNTITNIRSCADEIIGFFAKGTIDHISMHCRREINLITRQCWPALFIALGITPEDCSIIVAICEPSSGSSAPGPPVWYPTPPGKMKNATVAKRFETKAP